MDDFAMRHGCLLTSIVAVCCPMVARGADTATQTPVLTARTQRFDVAYLVNPEAEPLESVSLWYTYNDGVTWTLYGADDDRVSPISFGAPQEGLCGLYFVIANEAGPSGPPPTNGSVPHVWVLIDYTAPVVQLHEPALEQRPSGQEVVQIRWSAVDAQLSTRPVDLAYRVLPDGEWADAHRRVSNAGRYDWRVPEDLTGEIVIRISVRDQGGNITLAESKPISLANDVEPEETTQPEEATPSGQPEEAEAVPIETPQPEPLPAQPSEEEKERSRELLRKGRYHQIRAEHDLAIARLRDALKLDPSQSEALVRLGASLYALRQYDESVSVLESALEQSPHDRETLEGLARSLVAMKKYAAAEAKLFAILESSPEDVETWLHLGDVAIYRGDEIDAREYYGKAATLKPDAMATVERARARLDDLAGMSEYHRERTAQ